MRSKYSVKLKKLVEEHGGLEPLNLSSDYEQALISNSDVNRPAMQLTGFYDYFDPTRIQIMGRVESTYLDTLSPADRLKTFERFMEHEIAALVICHGVSAFSECIEMARKYDRNVFITDEDTSAFQADLIHSLQKYLAPRVTVHGVLVEIYGEGILLMATAASARARRRWSSSSAATVSSPTTRWKSGASAVIRSSAAHPSS